jgi:two-component system secretion response regulator SsrB
LDQRSSLRICHGDVGQRMGKVEMQTKKVRCALFADRHLGLVEGVRGLLETEFEAVVVVGDEVSLFETARQLDVTLAIVDLSLAHGDGLGLIRRIRNRFPQLKLIALSVHPEKSVEMAAIRAGANGFVPKGSIAADLLPTIDAVLARSTP